MQVINPMQIAKLSQVPKHLSIATTEQELRDIWHLRHAQYSPLYPDVKDFENDKYDQFAVSFTVEIMRARLLVRVNSLTVVVCQQIL